MKPKNSKTLLENEDALAQCICDSKTNDEISKFLYRSISWVKFYMPLLFEKYYSYDRVSFAKNKTKIDILNMLKENGYENTIDILEKDIEEAKKEFASKAEIKRQRYMNGKYRND